jgi:hypothetical protein
MRYEVGLTGMVFSIIAMTAGAVMCWAVTSETHGIRLATVGVILMVVGTIGLIVSIVVFDMCRRTAGSQNRPYYRQLTDLHGRTTVVHEEGH